MFVIWMDAAAYRLDLTAIIHDRFVLVVCIA
jgi:hypothetical protein